MILYAVHYCGSTTNYSHSIVNIHKTYELAIIEKENLEIQNSDKDCEYSVIAIDTDCEDDIIYDYEWYDK